MTLRLAGFAAVCFNLCGFLCAQTAVNSAPPAPEKTVIVVTGTWEPIPLAESDREVQLHKVREQSLVSNHPVDFLKLDPSLDLRQRAPNGVLGGVSIRGGSFAQTLVLMDGLRMNDAQTAHFNLDIPMAPESTDRIEILKGSGSTFYGADAVGGVVNVLPSPPAATEFRLRTGVGNFGSNQQRVSLGLATSRISQQLTAYRDFSTGFIENRDYRNLTLASTTYGSSGLGNSRLYLAHSDKPFGADQFYCPCNSWERIKTWFAGGSHQFTTGTNASFAYRRHTDLFVLYRNRPGQFTNRHALESWQGALRQSAALNSNTRLHYGGEFYHDAIQSNNLGSRSRSRGALYASLDARALNRFSFTAGAREEYFGAGRAQFIPSVGGGVWLGARTKVAASASRAFRIPTFTELYYRDPFSRGNAGLAPEEAWGYEGSLQFYPATHWRAGVTVFHRDEKNVIDWIRRSLAEPADARNIQQLHFTGVEASVARTLGRHVVEVRYTGLKGVQDVLPGLLSRYTFNYPSQAAVVHWNARLPKGFLARTRFGVTQRRARDPYTVVDAYLAWSEHSLRPFLQVTNLMDTTYQEILGVPMPGMGVMGGVEWRLGGGR